MVRQGLRSKDHAVVWYCRECTNRFVRAWRYRAIIQCECRDIQFVSLPLR